MKLQRQHFLLSYFKTLSDDPAGVELTTSRMTARCSTNWATGLWFNSLASLVHSQLVCLQPGGVFNPLSLFELIGCLEIVTVGCLLIRSIGLVNFHYNYGIFLYSVSPLLIHLIPPFGKVNFSNIHTFNSGTVLFLITTQKRWSCSWLKADSTGNVYR